MGQTRSQKSRARPALVLSTHARPACRAQSPPRPGPPTGEASEPGSWRCRVPAIPAACRRLCSALSQSFRRVKQSPCWTRSRPSCPYCGMLALYFVLWMPHKEVEDWGGCAIEFLWVTCWEFGTWLWGNCSAWPGCHGKLGSPGPARIAAWGPDLVKLEGHRAVGLA